jgi:hypothetical protein
MLWKDGIPMYDGDCDLAISHATLFLEFFSSINVTHEDVLMRLFVYSLEGDRRTWIKTCARPKQISCIAELIQVFLTQWTPTHEEDQSKRKESNAKLEENSIEYEVDQECAHAEGDQDCMPSGHEDKGLPYSEMTVFSKLYCSFPATFSHE